MTTTTVGLIGCGSWGRHILRDLQGEGCIVHVVARSATSRDRAKGADSVVQAIGDLPECDGYVVATPTTTHDEVIRAILPRRRPIFCEKPLTVSLERTRRIAAESNGLLFIMDKWRYHAGVLLLRSLARSGGLGRVQGIVTVRRGWQTHENPDTDAIWHLAPHDLAIALEILGVVPAPEAVRVERAPDGRVVAAYVLGGTAPWHVIDISESHPEHLREIRVVGEDREAVLSGAYSDHVLVWTRQGTRPPEPEVIGFENAMPLMLELREFVGYLRGGPVPKSSASDAVLLAESLQRIADLAS